MKRIDIIFTDALTKPLSFEEKEGYVLASCVGKGVYCVQEIPRTDIRNATPSPAVSYMYPLHTINRIKETL